MLAACKDHTGHRTRDRRERERERERGMAERPVSREVIAALLAIGGVESNPGPQVDPQSPSWATHPDMMHNGVMELQTFDPDQVAAGDAQTHRAGTGATCVQVDIPEAGTDGKFSRSFSCEVIQYSNPNSSTTTKTTITRGGLAKTVLVTPPITASTLAGDDTVDAPIRRPQLENSSSVDSEDQTEKVKELEKKIDGLEIKLFVEQDENNHLSEKLRTTVEESRMWVQERATYVTRINLFEQQVHQLIQDKAELEKLVADVGNPTIYLPPLTVQSGKKCNDETHLSQIQDLLAQVANLTEENRRLNDDLMTSHEANDREAKAWENIYRGLKEENEKHVEKVKKLQNKLDRESEEYRKHTSDLERSMEQLQSQIATLITTLEGFKVTNGGANTSRDRELNFYEQQITFLDGKVKELESHSERDKQRQEKQRCEMKDTVRREKEENEKMIEELRVYEVRGREVEELERAVIRETRRGDAAEDNFRDERDEREKMTEVVTQLRLEVLKYRNENEALKAKRHSGSDSDSGSTSGRKLKKLQQELTIEKEKNGGLVKNLESSKRGFDVKIQECEYLNLQLIQMKEKLESALVVKENDLRSLRERYASHELTLHGDREKAERTVAFWKLEYQKMKGAANHLEAQIKKEKGDIVKLKEKINWLEGQLKIEKDGSLQLKENINWYDGQMKKEKDAKLKADEKLRRLENQLQDTANRQAITEDALNEERRKAKKKEDDFKKSLEDSRRRNDMNENNHKLDAAQIEAGRKLKEEHLQEIDQLKARVKKLKDDLDKLQNTLKDRQINWNIAMKNLSDEKDKIQNDLTLANWELGEYRKKHGKTGNCFR